VTGRLAVVIVHWQDAAETLACVASLAAEPPDDVVVVDNGSAEPIGDLIARRAPHVDVLRLPENRGYAGGANVGIERVLARGAELVLLLNNDARLYAGAQAAARAALAGDPRIGVVGARVVTREDPTRLWLAWGEVTWLQSLVALHGADVPDGGRWRTPRDVDWVAGCAMWFRAETLRAVGLLDEAFFAYHEEVDWCARARRDGWRVVYWPDAVVTHTGRGSHGSARSIAIRKYFAARNTILFARKHARPLDWAKLIVSLAIMLPLELAWHAARGSAADTRLKLAGIRDAVRDRRPPFEALGLKPARDGVPGRSVRSG
jgi:GT2 family glycosyltransferase